MTATRNSKQIEFWNGAGGERWVRHRTEWDALFVGFVDPVLDRARLHPGDDVLDVGTGAGALAFAATHRVGPRGLVVGTDISGPLLAEARARAAAAGSLRMRFELADAQTAGFGGRRFDAVVSRFGVMFFDDPVGAFAKLRSSLRLGGRLSFACWQSADENPWISVPIAAAAGIVEIPSEDPGAPGPFSFGVRTRVENVVERAGFAAVSVTPLNVPLRFGDDVERASASLVATGPVGRALVNASEGVRARVVAELAKRLEPFDSRRGIILPSAAWLVAARNAER